MAFSVTIGSPGRDDMADPAEPAARPDPEARRDDQPENRSQDTAVIELPHARDEETEHCGDAWVRDPS